MNLPFFVSFTVAISFEFKSWKKSKGLSPPASAETESLPWATKKYIFLLNLPPTCFALYVRSLRFPPFEDVQTPLQREWKISNGVVLQQYWKVNCSPNQAGPSKRFASFLFFSWISHIWDFRKHKFFFASSWILSCLNVWLWRSKKNFHKWKSRKGEFNGDQKQPLIIPVLWEEKKLGKVCSSNRKQIRLKTFLTNFASADRISCPYEIWDFSWLYFLLKLVSFKILDVSFLPAVMNFSNFLQKMKTSKTSFT